ncbi:hypothetical protein [Pandoraea sp. NPDC087047]|uniref:hypothetical protein n=1 Tax=Pandoraea sp. NPDC087047 TaxID=3364390 RepID=UPI0037F78682
MQQHEPQAAMTEKTAAAARAPATELTSFAAAFARSLAAAAPPMAPTAPFVAEIHFVHVQRASAHEIAT